jgi:hypothetical protein
MDSNFISFTDCFVGFLADVGKKMSVLAAE